MYNNPYNGFNPQFNYGAPQYSVPPQQSTTNKIYVSGVEDVKSKMIPAGSDFIFLDNDKPILYQKVVDSSGHFEIKTFDIVPHKEDAENISYARLSDLDPILDDLKTIKKQMAEVYINKNTEVK